MTQSKVRKAGMSVCLSVRMLMRVRVSHCLYTHLYYPGSTNLA